MEPRTGFILLFIGIGSFVASLAVWFWLYPKRKTFLEQLKKEFNLEYPKGALILRKGKLKGLYRDHEITIAPFLTEGRLWILLKFLNPKDFLALIKPRKLGMLSTKPIFKSDRKELFTGNSAFDNRFKVFGKTVPEINRILTPSIQERLIQLAKKEIFEIQILRNGIFSYVSESKIHDAGLIKFILDLLTDIAKNIRFSK